MKKSNQLLRSSIILITLLLIQTAFAQTPVWSENFESLTNGAHYLGLGSTTILSNGGVNNSKCVEVEYERYDNGGTPRYLKKIAITPGTEYTLTYDIFFTSDWTIGTGGKYHGLVPTNPTTGCQPIEADGWSSRVVFDNREPFLYTYHQNKDWECGEKTRDNTIQLERGKWYAVSLYLKLNTADNVTDGYTRLYIDGQLIASQNQEFRSLINNATKITQFYFCTFLGAGPTGNIKSRNHARFDNFAIYPGEQIKDAPGDGITRVNKTPTVTVTAPQNNNTFVPGETIHLGANASDSDGSVTKVNFKIDGKYYSTDISAPYAGTFTPTTAGTYKISARAFDNDDASSEKSITITVRENTCEITPYININNEGWNQQTLLNVLEGDDVRFGPQSSTTAGTDATNWNWTGPNNFTATTREITLSNIKYDDEGTYTVSYTDPYGCTSSADITISLPEICWVNPYLNINNEGWNNISTIEVFVGDTVWFGPQSNTTAGANVPGWSWTGPDGFTFNQRSLLIENIQLNQSGNYIVSYLNETNCEASYTFTITVLEKKEAYLGESIKIPGIIEAENYDKGGERISYHDIDTENLGGAYRTDGVDIAALSENNFSVGWIRQGEWLEYTVDVYIAANYDFTIHYSSPNGGGLLGMNSDGEQVFSNHLITQTGSWGNYTETVIKSIPLQSGKQVFRFIIEQSGFNIDKIEISESPVTQTIELQQGWNLVSTYVHPKDSAIATLFPNASMVKTQETFYRSTQPNFLNTLTAIKCGVGYLVYNNIGETIDISGTVETRLIASLPSHNGWNLIGCPYPTPTSFETAFGTELENIQIIKNFDGFYEKNNPLSSLIELKPGLGYFIKK